MDESDECWRVDWAKRHGEGARATLICKLSHPVRSEKVLKIFLAPIPQATFGKVVDNQTTAQLALTGRLPNVVPCIHKVSQRYQAVLMDFVGAETLAGRLSRGEAELALFGTIGEALGCLSRSTQSGSRKLRDMAMFEPPVRIIEDVYNGRRGMAFPRRFLTLADAFRDHLKRHGDELVTVGLRHGDLNTENIRVSGTHVHLIDFEGVGRGIVLDDLMHVFVQATLERAPHREQDYVNRREQAALLAGFASFESREVPRGVLQTLYLHRLVRAWFHLTRGGLGRQDQMRPRFRGLIEMSERALAMG